MTPGHRWSKRSRGSILIGPSLRPGRSWSMSLRRRISQSMNLVARHRSFSSTKLRQTSGTGGGVAAATGCNLRSSQRQRCLRWLSDLRPFSPRHSWILKAETTPATNPTDAAGVRQGSSARTESWSKLGSWCRNPRQLRTNAQILLRRQSRSRRMSRRLILQTSLVTLSMQRSQLRTSTS